MSRLTAAFQLLVASSVRSLATGLFNPLATAPISARLMASLPVLATAVFLGACTVADGDRPGSAAEANDAAERAARDVRLQALDDFTVSGSLGFWDDTQNATSSVVWNEREGLRDILLAGPLGIGRMQLVESAEGVALARGDAPVVTGVDAGAMLGMALGLGAAVPLDAVSDWIRGLPGPNATRVQRDESGRLLELSWTDDAGVLWRASVRRYLTVDGLDLPRLLTARSTAGNLRLVLSDWLLDTSSDTAEEPDSPASEGATRLGIPGR